MSTQYQQVKQAAAYIRERTSLVPKVVLVLGSGLGDYADRMEQAQVISYEEIPGFPISTVKEHKAKLILGTLFDVPVAIMQGRRFRRSSASSRTGASVLTSISSKSCSIW